MVPGVMRNGLLGFPACIIQYKCTTPISAAWVWGTVRASILQNVPEYKGMITMSGYDSKPANFIFMIAESL